MTPEEEAAYQRGKFDGYAEMYQYIGETLAVWAAVANDQTLTAAQAMEKLQGVVERFTTAKAVN